MFIKQVNLIAGFFSFLSASSLVISLHGTVYCPDDVQVINTLACVMALIVVECKVVTGFILALIVVMCARCKPRDFWLSHATWDLMCQSP